MLFGFHLDCVGSWFIVLICFAVCFGYRLVVARVVYLLLCVLVVYLVADLVVCCLFGLI